MILDLSTASPGLLSSIRTTLGAVGLTGVETVQNTKNFTQGQILSAGVDLLTLIGSGGGGSGLDIATLNNYLSTNRVILSTANVLTNFNVVGIVSATNAILSSGQDLLQVLVPRTTLNSITGVWQSTYGTVSSLSSTWLNQSTVNSYLSTNVITLTTTNVLGDLTVYGLISSLSSVAVNQIVTQTQDISTSTTGLFITGDVSFTNGYILSSGQDLLQVFVPRTTLNTISADWQSGYTTTNSNSSFWTSNYTTTNTNSANWQSTYETVSSLSASWSIDSTIDTGVRSLTSNWDSTYVTVSTLSASWGIDSTTDTGVRSLTSKWDSNYTTTNNNSANWQNGYSTTNSNSANWILQNGNSFGQALTLGTNDVNDIQFITSNTVRATILENGTIEINDNNQPSDFQVGSQATNALFFINGSTSLIGINTNTPTERLTVIGNITAAGNISGGNINVTGRVTANEILTNNLSALGDITYINTSVSVVSSVTVENYGTGPALLVQQHGNQPAARFVDKDNNTPFAIEDSGKVVIGNTVTSSQILTIHGGLSSRDSINVGTATSDSWNSNYTTTNTNSAAWGANNTAFLTAQNFEAASGLRYLVNTLTNVVTAFLPTTPATGTIIYFEDPFNYWNTQNFVVSSNNKIGGRFEPLNCDISDAAFYLTFVSTLTGWKIKII